METPGPILVCFAVAEEARPFRKRLGAGAGARVLVTGMGARRANAAIRRALAETRPRLVITSGFAGGLNPALERGAVLFEADAAFPVSPDALRSAGARPGQFHCAARVAATVADKQALRRETGADAVEMESAILRTACREANIPSATIRVISDAADENLPLDFNQFMTPGGGMNYARLALAVIKSPSKIGELREFQQRVARAAETLAETLARLINQL